MEPYLKNTEKISVYSVWERSDLSVYSVVNFRGSLGLRARGLPKACAFGTGQFRMRVAKHSLAIDAMGRRERGRAGHSTDGRGRFLRRGYLIFDN